MSLVYDYKSGMFVVNPKFVELDPEVVALSVEYIFRKYLAIPVLEDGRRLLILVIEPIRRIDLDDIELVTGFKPVEARLDLHGGIVPSWQDIDSQPPVDARPWRKGDFAASLMAMKKLLNLAYGDENPPPPDTGWQDVAPTHLPYTDQDEMPVIRAVDLILKQAIKDSISQLWVLPRPKQLQVLARKQGTWIEWMTPSILLHTQIIARLKRVADLIVSCQTTQQATFQAHGRSFKLETHLSENGEEAFITLLD